MLPASLQTPAAIVLVLGGLLSCFAGYRVFRIVLGIYGFILGALIASSFMGTDQTLWMIVAAIVGGIAGAAILILAYFVGVALIGAGVGALAANAIWAALGREPRHLVVIVLAITGALCALALQRYVIIVSTAFGGAWTTIVGGLALAGDRRGGAGGGAKRRLAGVPVESGTRAAVGDCRLARDGLAGALVQTGITAKRKK